MWVIIASGVGSCFLPLGTPEYPKQFIDILGCGRTLIQLTVDRFKGICPMSNFWVVTNSKYADIVKQQLPDIPQTIFLQSQQLAIPPHACMGMLEHQERKPKC